MSADSDTPDDLLPLPAATLHILLALAVGDRHGYAIMQAATQRTEGRARLNTGTLYTTIRRLVARGLVVELEISQLRKAQAEGDARRRYYRLTPAGRRVARLELARLQELLSLGRQAGLLGDRG